MKELQKVSEAAVLCKGNKGMGVLSRNLPTELNSVAKSELTNFRNYINTPEIWFNSEYKQMVKDTIDYELIS